ncbi:hypothetical protein CONPUDRAFT_160098 [Coniophora puteana RWD-64-598 SS2]|uniref:Uncharacterized protein n=1 Tax=Coniophora puteana (strain RWD-64-598) TaxID=741705 RepID=R7SET7_CONPW|nr:uncharacterized protein CONPUDRAFT_160098 [Coniophora puteana RWD-64-598 SS2]EIW74385.1 hypothetical protein CONPUDRAFT_160098 [Coniophora puteana RWD-64-598 SS2]
MSSQASQAFRRADELVIVYTPTATLAITFPSSTLTRQPVQVRTATCSVIQLGVAHYGETLSKMHNSFERVRLWRGKWGVILVSFSVFLVNAADDTWSYAR